MSFRWVYRNTPKAISGESDRFESQQDAEDWMGREWESLLGAGHVAATLMDGEQELYTMNLGTD